MAAQIRFLILLVSALFTSGFADFIDVENERIIYEQSTSNISDLVDGVLPMLREYILQKSLDPMKLDDITEKLPGPVIRDRVIYLTKGFLQGLSEITRAGDALLISGDDTFTVDMKLGFSTLDANYDYLLKDFFITRKGQMNGRFINLEIKVVADMNLSNRKVVLRAVNIVRVDNLSITFRGHGIDSLLNAILKRITKSFRDSILRLVEKKMTVIAQEHINKVIENLPFSNEFLKNNDVLEIIPTSFNFIPA